MQFTYMAVGKSDGSFGEIDNLPTSTIAIVSGTLADVEEVKTYIKESTNWIETLEKGNKHGMYPVTSVEKFQTELKSAGYNLKTTTNKEHAQQIKANLLKSEAALRASRIIDINEIDISIIANRYL